LLVRQTKSYIKTAQITPLAVLHSHTTEQTYLSVARFNQPHHPVTKAENFSLLNPKQTIPSMAVLLLMRIKTKFDSLNKVVQQEAFT
jgi:hypothetical protein